MQEFIKHVWIKKKGIFSLRTIYFKNTINHSCMVRHYIM